jgi:hypothetical protein
VIGVVAVLTAAVALVSVPAAFGAVDGDPIATKTFKFKLSGSFKKQLKKNGVKMKPKKLKLTKGDVDPTTGAADVRLGKVTFKKGSKKIVFNNLKGSMPGKVKANEGAIFKLTAPKVARNGFGADLTGIKFKFLKSAAKKVNKALGLHSLKKGVAAKASLSYQPETVKITSGFVFVNIPCGFLPPLQPALAGACPGSGADPGTVAAKQPAHCIGPADGVSVIPGDPANPARFSSVTSADPVLGPPPAGVGARFRFPVTGGTISPAGNDGVVQVSGGVRLASGYTGLDVVAFGARTAGCDASETPGPTTSHSFLDTLNLAPNLGLSNVQADTTIGGTSPGCNGTGAACGLAIIPGPKGIAIGQALDTAGQTVSADASTKKITVSGGLIRNNATATTVLNGLFPNASGNPARAFTDGDKFGIPTLDVNTR